MYAYQWWSILPLVCFEHCNPTEFSLEVANMLLTQLLHKWVHTHSGQTCERFDSSLHMIRIEICSMHAKLHCYISSERKLSPSVYRSTDRRNANARPRSQLSQTSCCTPASDCSLLTAIEDRSNKSEAPFHVPGHKVCKHETWKVCSTDPLTSHPSTAWCPSISAGKKGHRKRSICN